MNNAASVVKVKLQEIQRFRALFLQESNFQVRYNACHERGWTDSYLLVFDGAAVGYGAVKGQEIAGRDTIFEFYVVPPHRKSASDLFGALIAASNAKFIESQSNDQILSAMLYEFGRQIAADTILFEDRTVTDRKMPGAAVRRRRDSDVIFEHTVEPVGDYVLEFRNDVVATAGFLLHYNPPFADLYMEVREDCRGRGFASFILQEVKRECYLAGRVPAARCGVGARASRGALLNAGLRRCGFMLIGHIRNAA